MGLAYLGLSSAQGAPLLTDNDISAGLAAPLVAQKLLGTTGEYAILFLILMAVMSTGSAEVIAVASIIIYDIYQVNIVYMNVLYWNRDINVSAIGDRGHPIHKVDLAISIF